MDEETQSSFAYDRCDVKQAGTAQDFATGDKIVSTNLALHIEGVQSSPVGLYDCPAF